MNNLTKNSFNLALLTLYIVYTTINTTSAGPTYIGGINSWNANGDGTICSPNIGVNSNQTQSSYSCTVALQNGNIAIVKVETDYSGLATAIENATESISSSSYQPPSTPSSHLANKTYNFAGQSPSNSLSVGELGKERTIQNVAAGQISETSTDAVNGSQLYAAYDAISAIYDAQIAGYDTQIMHLDNRVNQLNNDISQLRDSSYAGIAGAMAIGNLPQPIMGGKNMVSGGMGTYKGHTAAAFGLSSITENEKVIWKIGATIDNKQNSGGAVSIGYQW